MAIFQGTLLFWYLNLISFNLSLWWKHVVNFTWYFYGNDYNCIGMIARVYVPVVLSIHKQHTYKGRKGKSIINWMYACDFDMKFTFAFIRWEGLSHDIRILLNCLNNKSDNFPKLSRGLYCWILINVLKHVLCNENANVINILICRKILSCWFKIPYEEMIHCTI